MHDALTQAQSAMVEAVALSPVQRRALSAIAKHGLERCKTGWRPSFTVQRASFANITVSSLLARRLCERTGIAGRIAITEAGRAALAVPLPTRPPAPLPAGNPAALAPVNAARRAASAETPRMRLPYADD